MNILLRLNRRSGPARKPLRALAMLFCFLVAAGAACAQGRVVEILADHDSRYKIAGMNRPVITASPGEPLTLRITAVKAKNHNRDGSIHGFTLLDSKTHRPVASWDFLLHPGTQEYSVIAPPEPGEYEIVCTVICSGNHEGMTMKLIVLPAGETAQPGGLR